MKIVDVIIHKLVVTMKPDTVHSSGIQDTLCAPDPITGRVMNFHEFPKWIIELVADSGAAANVAPKHAFPGVLKPNACSKSEKYVVSASKERVYILDEKSVAIRTQEGRMKMVTFQIADVGKILLSVKKAADQDNTRIPLQTFGLPYRVFCFRHE